VLVSLLANAIDLFVWRSIRDQNDIQSVWDDRVNFVMISRNLISYVPQI